MGCEITPASGEEWTTREADGFVEQRHDLAQHERLTLRDARGDLRIGTKIILSGVDIDIVRGTDHGHHRPTGTGNSVFLRTLNWSTLGTMSDASSPRLSGCSHPTDGCSSSSSVAPCAKGQARHWLLPRRAHSTRLYGRTGYQVSQSSRAAGTVTMPMPSPQGIGVIWPPFAVGSFASSVMPSRHRDEILSSAKQTATGGSYSVISFIVQR